MLKMSVLALMAALLASCQRADPPEVASIKASVAAGKLVEAEARFDNLSQDLKDEHQSLLCELGRGILSGHLKSVENNLRYHALIAFYQFEDEGDLPIFREALKDPYFKVQTTAAEALGDLGDESYKDAMYALLGDADEEARFLAAAILLKYGDTKGLPVLFEILIKGEDPRNRRKAAAALGEWGPDAKEVSDHLKLAAMRDENLFVRIDALKAVGERDDPKRALSGLRVLKEANNIYVKLHALAVLSTLGDEPATQELLGYLKDKNQTLRLEALLTAAELGFPEATPELFHVLTTEDIPARSRAVTALAETGDEKYLPDIKKIFRQIDDRVLRINFVKAMTELAPEEDIYFMKDLAPNEDPFLEIYAARSLCLIYHRYK